MSVERVAENIWILKDANALVTLAHEPVCDDIGKVSNITYGEDLQAKIKNWGKRNNTPWEREQLISDNNIIPELLRIKRDITVGAELYPYTLRIEGGKRVIEEVDMPPIAKEFFDRVDIYNYLMCAAKNLLVHANVFTEFIRDKGGGIYSIESKECRHIRAQAMDEAGMIKNYFWRGNWKPNKAKDGVDFPIRAIPNYTGEKSKQNKFLLHSGDDLLSDEYYFIPTWWGGKSWIELSNRIPVFHQSNLAHGYNIRYHIEIPKDYFFDNTSTQNTPDQRKQAEAEATTAKSIFLERMNEFLAGVQNAGRAVYTEYELNRSVGKDYPGIKIKPLEVDLQDEALLKLFEKSNQANMSAQGVHPTLANIETQGKLSSGSEIRNAYLMYLAIKTPMPRRILLKAIELVHKINGWPEPIRWGFRDIEITKLDENPTAQQEVAVQ